MTTLYHNTLFNAIRRMVMKEKNKWKKMNERKKDLNGEREMRVKLNCATLFLSFGVSTAYSFFGND